MKKKSYSQDTFFFRDDRAWVFFRRLINTKVHKTFQIYSDLPNCLFVFTY